MKQTNKKISDFSKKGKDKANTGMKRTSYHQGHYSKHFFRLSLMNHMDC